VAIYSVIPKAQRSPFLPNRFHFHGVDLSFLATVQNPSRPNFSMYFLPGAICMGATQG
jgi:hypothetical protein